MNDEPIAERTRWVENRRPPTTQNDVVIDVGRADQEPARSEVLRVADEELHGAGEHAARLVAAVQGGEVPGEGILRMESEAAARVEAALTARIEALAAQLEAQTGARQGSAAPERRAVSFADESGNGGGGGAVLHQRHADGALGGSAEGREAFAPSTPLSDGRSDGRTDGLEPETGRYEPTYWGVTANQDGTYSSSGYYGGYYPSGDVNLEGYSKRDQALITSALGGDDGDDVLQKATPLPYREANSFPLAPPFREKLMHGDPGAMGDAATGALVSELRRCGKMDSAYEVMTLQPALSKLSDMYGSLRETAREMRDEVGMHDGATVRAMQHAQTIESVIQHLKERLDVLRLNHGGEARAATRGRA